MSRPLSAQWSAQICFPILFRCPHHFREPLSSSLIKGPTFRKLFLFVTVCLIGSEKQNSEKHFKASVPCRLHELQV
ncbi:hypothetical protein AB6A40_000168 [Gnathostoma spinigerum]|uniref:Uncharacterized protein n=1 Tax=Gnathostoma spinigerum TaxID=75299 RepID=A0ABD6E7V5_9BILA